MNIKRKRFVNLEQDLFGLIVEVRFLLIVMIEPNIHKW